MNILKSGLEIAEMAGHAAKYFSGSRKRKREGGVIRGKTSYMAAVSLSNGVANLPLSDVSVGSDDIVTLASIYRYYRFKNIVLEFPAPEWSTASLIGVGFVSSPYYTAPAAFADIEATETCLLSASSTVSTKYRVAGSMIHDAVNWFVTEGDATDTALETQGQFFFRSTVISSETIYFKITLEFEFRGMIDPSVIGSLLKTAAAIKEQEQEEKGRARGVKNRLISSRQTKDV
jgi:hypothetical protein